MSTVSEQMQRAAEWPIKFNKSDYICVEMRPQCISYERKKKDKREGT